jgi:hypothetical protein
LASSAAVRRRVKTRVLRENDTIQLQSVRAAVLSETTLLGQHDIRMYLACCSRARASSNKQYTALIVLFSALCPRRRRS